MDEHYAYTRQEAADFLRVSLRTINLYLVNGTLASHKVGGRRLIPATALRRLVDGDSSGERSVS